MTFEFDSFRHPLFPPMHSFLAYPNILWLICSDDKVDMRCGHKYFQYKIREMWLHLLGHHDSSSHSVRQLTTEFSLYLSRRTERNKHLIYYYPITEHDILIQPVETHNKLKITLSASLGYDNWLHLLTFLHLWYYLEHLVLTFLHKRIGNSL